MSPLEAVALMSPPYDAPFALSNFDLPKHPSSRPTRRDAWAFKAVCNLNVRHRQRKKFIATSKKYPIADLLSTISPRPQGHHRRHRHRGRRHHLHSAFALDVGVAKEALSGQR